MLFNVKNKSLIFGKSKLYATFTSSFNFVFPYNFTIIY